MPWETHRSTVVVGEKFYEVEVEVAPRSIYGRFSVTISMWLLDEWDNRVNAQGADIVLGFEWNAATGEETGSFRAD